MNISLSLSLSLAWITVVCVLQTLTVKPIHQSLSLSLTRAHAHTHTHTHTHTQFKRRHITVHNQLQKTNDLFSFQRENYKLIRAQTVQQQSYILDDPGFESWLALEPNQPLIHYVPGAHGKLART